MFGGLTLAKLFCSCWVTTLRRFKTPSSSRAAAACRRSRASWHVAPPAGRSPWTSRTCPKRTMSSLML
eukprot:3843522-Pyramimonas_sp.AAC.1